MICLAFNLINYLFDNSVVLYLISYSIFYYCRNIKLLVLYGLSWPVICKTSDPAVATYIQIYKLFVIIAFMILFAPSSHCMCLVCAWMSVYKHSRIVSIYKISAKILTYFIFYHLTLNQRQIILQMSSAHCCRGWFKLLS